jgi:hypothetical protein
VRRRAAREIYARAAACRRSRCASARPGAAWWAAYRWRRGRVCRADGLSDDIAWALAAQRDVKENGGLLDEVRLNRMRYQEGTPKGATRGSTRAGSATCFDSCRPVSRCHSRGRVRCPRLARCHELRVQDETVTWRLVFLPTGNSRSTSVSSPHETRCTSIVYRLRVSPTLTLQYRPEHDDWELRFDETTLDHVRPAWASKP